MTKREDPENVEMKVAFKHISFDKKEVLEIGCGEGRLTFQFAGMAKRVMAIDPESEDVKIAKRGVRKNLAKKVTFRVGRGEELTFPNESFDNVFYTGSLCCTDILNMGKSLDQVWRV